MHMARSSAEQIRDWRGPALLSFGFRPFFLLGALWAVLAMALWIPALTGAIALPTHLDPVAWHAHAFLFGYLGAVMAGFLLTAVPNWTGGLPVVGRPLGALALLWAAGRLAVLVSAHLPVALTAAVDLAFPLALGALLLREILAGRNWRNLPVLALLGLFALANATFHLEAGQGGDAASGVGVRLGLAAALGMIALIGGRIVPSFTRNWLVRRGPGRLPVPPMRKFDQVALLVLFAALVAWVAAPASAATGASLTLAGALHLARLVRWAGDRTLREPLVLVLHVGYAFLPLGALALGAEILKPGPFGMAAAQHLWMGGAIGLMSLAVMTRATLGHTGQALTAGPGTGAIFLALVAAVLARLIAGLWPASAQPFHALSGAAWIVAFGGFAFLYGPLLLRRRAEP